MEVIDPALERGAVVISDRYVLATLAVFTHRGVDPDFLIEINGEVTHPDFAFYLEVPTEALLQRLRAMATVSSTKKSLLNALTRSRRDRRP
ncbi:dTMP kinase [Neorhizobium galegae]|uniref:dTMP kinase n=1 Tax=Neorhizobium galegae TaxID=399 RepID=UPI002101652C|nr:hypothetical protein [Neorhizobium galegae]MCQ1569974.1 hypothetical protein [Neorhizobium galegae]MCQ1807512.1 hypothetical protein [Neorhizobium galegae]